MDDSSKAPALERGLAILEALARSRGGLTLSQITRYLDLPKSSAFLLVRTLEKAGYIFRDVESGKYSMSLRVCSLANLALNAIGLRDQARPFLRRLSTETRLTVHMAIIENGSCVLIEKLSPSGTYPIATWVGKHLSLHCTAIGKAVAAHLPEETLMTLLRQQGMLRHNENTICSTKRLQNDLALVRQRGYSVDDEEEEISIRCIGAPLFDNSTVIGAISLVGTTNEIHGANLEGLAAELIQTAMTISGQVRLPDGAGVDISGPLRMKAAATPPTAPHAASA